MKIAAALLFLCAAPAFQEPAQPRQVHVNLALIQTTEDVWKDLAEVDPTFKALGAEAERLAKGLEAEDIEIRGKASNSLKALGLSAYGAIKSVRDKAESKQLRAELDSVLKHLGGNAAVLSEVPAARKVAAKDGAALLELQKERKRVVQEPSVILKENGAGTAFVGDGVLADTGRTITIAAGEKSVEVEKNQSIVPRGIRIAWSAGPIDVEKRQATVEIKATHYGPHTPDKCEPVTASIKPVLASGEFYLAGPFPPAGGKDAPWWMLVEVVVVGK